MINQNFASLALRNLLTTRPTSYYIKKIDGSFGNIWNNTSGTFYIDKTFGKISYYTFLNGKNTYIVGNLTFGLGLGTLEPSINDYCLQTPIEDDVFLITSASNTEYDNTTFTELPLYQRTLSITYQYLGTDTVTISEVGLFFVGGYSNVAYPKYMLSRDVLETPITVSTNDVFTVTMVIS